MGVGLGPPQMNTSKHSHIIYRQKAFLLLILNFEFVLPDFDIWPWGGQISGHNFGQKKLHFFCELKDSEQKQNSEFFERS